MTFCYLLFLFQFLFSFQFIIIPFESSLSKISDDLSSQEFIRKLINNDIYSEINIGTPFQKINFSLNFNSYSSYILQENITEEKKNIIKYNKSISSSYKKYSNSTLNFEEYDFLKGYNSSDIILLNNNTNFNLNFILVSLQNEKTNLNKIASLGFGIFDFKIPFLKENGFIIQLKKKNLTKNYQFTLIYNNNNFNGKIIIGRNIYEKYSDDFFNSYYIMTNSDYSFNWGYNYIYIKFDDLNFTIKNFIVKPELSLIIGNKILMEKFKQYFINKINERKCFEVNIKYIFYYCNEDVDINFPNLFFINKKGNMNISLDKNDLIYKYNNINYFLIAFNKKDSENDNILIGYPFLRKFDFIFDIDKKHLGYYNFKIKFDENDEIKEQETEKKEEEEKKEKEDKNDNEKKEKIIPEQFKEKNYKIYFVFLLFFIIVIIVFIIFIQYRNLRRKKGFSQKHDFEYMEQI